MDPLQPFLELLLPLHSLRSPYMISGGAAAIAFGVPRLTTDIDIVLGLAQDEAGRFAELYSSKDFYIPPDEAIERELARPKRGHFNIMAFSSGMRADIYLPGRGEFEWWGLRNRTMIPIAGCELPFAPLEYSITKKLEFYRQGGSEKHLKDLAGVWRLSANHINGELLSEFLAERGLVDFWEKVKTLRLEE